MPTQEQLDEHTEVLQLLAGQVVAAGDDTRHAKLAHFHEHGRLPDPEPVEAEAVETPFDEPEGELIP